MPNLNREALIAKLQGRGFSIEDVNGSGANGYVKNSDIVDLLNSLDKNHSSMAIASFESRGEIVVMPEKSEDAESMSDHPAKGLRI
jgi:hypothetical protein